MSTHSYGIAHALAEMGHHVHVVTNANEVESRFRMYMRSEDWAKCERDYPSGGYVHVHWTDPDELAQRHIPWNNPFVTKLASLSYQVILDNALEVIFSYYLEPYGIAGHLAAEMTARPHVVKHAGSDVGRLRKHSQFAPLFDHVFRTATRVVVGRSLVGDLHRIGVGERRLCSTKEHRMPAPTFNPNGDKLDLTQLISDVQSSPEFSELIFGNIPMLTPIIGVYGKIGRRKGTYELLRAVSRLKRQGQSIGLVVLGHHRISRDLIFQSIIAEHNLEDCVLQLPFLPNWRIPEFIRLCRAICFLEHGSRIGMHRSVIPREVFACGKCLISSTDELNRQLNHEQLIHMHNCIAVEDVRGTKELATKIEFVLRHPEKARLIGNRGYRYLQKTKPVVVSGTIYDDILSEAIG